jgi:signal transduction histidine kinase
MKILIAAFLFTSIWSICFAQYQDKNIDSLKQELTFAKQDTSRVQLMVSISYNYRYLNLDSSNYYGLQALEMANKIDYLKGKVQATNRMSFFYRYTGNLPKALELSFKVLQLTENHPLEEETAIALSAIGNVYNELEDFSKALSYYKKVRLVKEKANQTADILYCYVFMNIGAQFEEINQLDSAWYYFQKSLQVFEKSKIEIVPQLYRHFGKVQFKSGNMPIALGYYRKSLQVTNTIKNQSALSSVLLALSELYQKVNQPDSSIYYAKNAFFEAQKISSKNKEMVAAALQLSKLYEKINTNEAFRYYKIAVETKDNLYGSSNLEAIQTIVSQEEERKKEIETNRIKYQNQLKQYALLAGLGVLLLFALFLYHNNLKEKKAKILLQEKNQIIEQTLVNLKSTQAQLIQSEKLASLGELTAGIAHEIQNPLNFVNNFAEVSAEMLGEMKDELKAGNTAEAIEIADDLERNLSKINHHGQRASSIVKGMLEHSRASTGVKEPTDLNALADEYLRLAYHGLRAKDSSFNAAMETHFDPDLPLVSVIPQDIGRVMLNLINNAFYAVAERRLLSSAEVSRSTVHQRAVETLHVTSLQFQPTVTLSTQKTGDQIIIKVQDNGNGIPESIREKIFQPFFTTKPTGQGTGLGLSLAYDIVTKGHGGTLEVESTEGCGSAFSIKLSVV